MERDGCIEEGEGIKGEERREKRQREEIKM